MEAVTQILEAQDLMRVMYIPVEMRHSRIEVTLRPIDNIWTKEAKPLNINKEIMQKFLKAAESGEAKEHIKRKLAEGTQFDFDAIKLMNGTMSEADWQNLYSLQKQAWSSAAVQKAIN